MNIFQFLGTGASAGIPVIACMCSVCSSQCTCNQRLRPSGLISWKGKKILLDVGPDFRQQALKYTIRHLDGLMLTHTHFDHIAGIDELRIFYLNENRPLPCLLSKESWSDLEKRYYYLFQPIAVSPTLSAQIDLYLLPEDFGCTQFLGLEIFYFSYFQGNMKVTGYRIGDFAYVSDIRRYENSVLEAIKGVRTLVLGALQKESSRFHFSLDEAVVFAKKVKPKMTYLTHINHTMDHESTNRALPSDIKLAHDGLEIEFET